MPSRESFHVTDATSRIMDSRIRKGTLFLRNQKACFLSNAIEAASAYGNLRIGTRGSPFRKRGALAEAWKPTRNRFAKDPLQSDGGRKGARPLARVNVDILAPW